MFTYWFWMSWARAGLKLGLKKDMKPEIIELLSCLSFTRYFELCVVPSI